MGEDQSVISLNIFSWEDGLCMCWQWCDHPAPVWTNTSVTLGTIQNNLFDTRIPYWAWNRIIYSRGRRRTRISLPSYGLIFLWKNMYHRIFLSTPLKTTHCAAIFFFFFNAFQRLGPLRQLVKICKGIHSSPVRPLPVLWIWGISQGPCQGIFCPWFFCFHPWSCPVDISARLAKD